MGLTMLNVFFTIDVEVWLEEWKRKERFPFDFRRYVYGPTKGGEYGLPFKLKVFQDYGISASFFVESLFASFFGVEPLKEIIGLIKEKDQEIQLHMHTEWVEKLENSILGNRKISEFGKFSSREINCLLETAMKNIQAAGVDTVKAYRGGNYQISPDILKALALNRISIDTSYNPCSLEACSKIHPDGLLLNPKKINGIIEYPVSAFRDFWGHLRPMQISASSYGEMTHFLWKAVEKNFDAVVIVSHNFELMDPRQAKADSIVVKRFIKLCQFLDKNRDVFRSVGFNQANHPTEFAIKQIVPSNFQKNITRLVEQGTRNFFYGLN